VLLVRFLGEGVAASDRARLDEEAGVGGVAVGDDPAATKASGP
jgi:hypothetical protein